MDRGMLPFSIHLVYLNYGYIKRVNMSGLVLGMDNVINVRAIPGYLALVIFGLASIMSC